MSSILSVLEHFSFTIVPADIETTRRVVAAQLRKWNKDIAIDGPATRDVAPIYCSKNGPDASPVERVAILLSEVVGPGGPYTLFVSSVADGYNSLVHMISKSIVGIHTSIQISRLDIPYPRNAITSIQGNDACRVVFSMRDTNKWVFFEQGRPMEYEEPANYLFRRKRDRLTEAIVATYLARYGYGSLDKDYWWGSNAPAWLICENGFDLAKNH